eukprot:TRINITY_DN7724_c0_g1_i2.p1 TRINITY_DN7724_c0_g1~~TRINITY_DN7724_c0_g1_i2.p1  ORF type:complete len:649 (-),score=109.52 TRINITY_DN7724_c0_g1_i2:111-2057(-)
MLERRGTHGVDGAPKSPLTGMPTPKSAPPLLPGGDTTPLPQGAETFRATLASAICGLQEFLVLEHEKATAKLQSQVDCLNAKIALLEPSNCESEKGYSNDVVSLSEAKPAVEQIRRDSSVDNPRRSTSSRYGAEDYSDHLWNQPYATRLPSSMSFAGKRPTDASSYLDRVLSKRQDASSMRRSSLRRLGTGDSLMRITFREAVAKHQTLVDLIMSIIVLLNATLLGVSCDAAPEQRLVYEWFEVVFAVIFSGEILFRLWLLRLGFVTGPEWRWNVFEGLLTIQANMDLWINWAANRDRTSSSLVRMVRLCRITRFVRLFRLHLFHDLLLMVNGTLGGIRTLCWSAVIIACPVYIVAIILRESLGGEPDLGKGEQMFRSLSSSFFTVFRCVVCGDCSTENGSPVFVLVSSNYGWGFSVLYMGTMLFMTFGLFNVIISIYVENTVEAANFNVRHHKRLRLRDEEFLQQTIERLITMLWRKHCEHQGTDEDECPLGDLRTAVSKVALSRQMFDEVMADEEFHNILQDMDIADDNQLDLFESLDINDNGFLDLDELISGLCKLRGDARRSDVISMSLLLRAFSTHFSMFEAHVIHRLNMHDMHFHGLAASAQANSKIPMPSLVPPAKGQHQNAEGLHALNGDPANLQTTNAS